MTTALRPMSTGEILDRTFALYRRNFKLFAGIAAIPAAFYFVVQLLFLLIGTENSWTARSGTATAAAIAFTSISAFVGLVLYLVSIAVSQAATVFGVSSAHLEKPTSIRECYARVKGHYGRMVNVIVTVYLRIFGVIILSYLVFFAVIFFPTVRGSRPDPVMTALFGFLFLIGLLIGIFLAIRLFARYSLAVPACALEDIKARDAIKRSVFLSKGSIGKILAIYMLVFVLTLAVSFAISIPIGALITAAKTTVLRSVYTVLQHFASFIVSAVVGPLGTIALGLVYYDERVRKEAFDIQYLMEAAAAGETPVAPQQPTLGSANASA